MIWYFAYGSNMNPARLADQRLKERAVRMGRRIGGRLDGWRLVFNKVARAPAGAAAANIVEASGEVVHGSLNEMPDAGLEVLDIWEGVAGGHYERRAVPVVRADTGETVEAVAYVALKVGDGLKPTREYLSHLLAGSGLLPVGYREKLKEIPTLD
ncbi:MAG TPA: gamma-glutamylcyclotransferase family protein [Reyranella sp.]|nr:gamma-glutamylcyclotransferase family protein [Reyranella sp.]